MDRPIPGSPVLALGIKGEKWSADCAKEARIIGVYQVHSGSPSSYEYEK